MQGPFLHPHRNCAKVIGNLLVQSSPCICNLVAPVQPLDCLLGSKSDEHAEYDDADLADKLAPAVQRFRQV